ncbi:MAG: energy-coupled thiamine transporter ThiT [Pseudobutyrivibrio sp.]|nr:energy-coupled thiamine transporter ThiT [Pseudobutyrivibrio sp.]
MFYDSVVNEWGELTYVPTFLGKVLIAAIMVLFLGVSLLIVKGKEKTSSKELALSTKQITFTAMSMALAYVLSTYFKVKLFPSGGSVTLLSMLVVCLPAYWYGTGAGILAGVSFGLLNLITDPYVIHPAQLIVDYFLAFGSLGLCGLFSNKKNGLIKGYIVGVTGRFIFAFISGWIFFGYYAWDGWAVIPYSIIYNLSYILPEAVATIILLSLPPIKSAMVTLKDLATK